jgi:putative inorganic carbon (HCO3(-)) transporter
VTPDRLRAILQTGVLALVFLTPLPFGSVQTGAVLAIELSACALGLGTVLLLRTDYRSARAIPKFPAAVCVGLIVLGILQLIPIPFSIAQAFNPTVDLMRPLVPYLGLTELPGVSWSVASTETMDALLRFISYVLIGLATSMAFRSKRSRNRWMFALLLAAIFQSVYGSGEYLTGRQHIFGYAKQYYLDSATGTFINRNHFATFLAIALPYAIACAMTPSRAGQNRTWRERIIGFTEASSVLRLLGTVAIALIWMGLLLSHSRAGLLSALAGMSVMLFQLRGYRAARMTAVVGGLVFLAVLTRELAQTPWERFVQVPNDLVAKGGRLEVWRDSERLFAMRPLLGWGFGTFEIAFPIVQSADINVHYDHAHNEWVEWTIEGGVLALVSVVMLLAYSLRRSDAASRAAVVAVALHAVWDFSLRIPSNAVAVAATIGFGYAAYADATVARATASAFPPPSMNASNHSSRLRRFQMRWPWSKRPLRSSVIRLRMASDR